MFCCKESSRSSVFLDHDVYCHEECCESKPRIDRYERALKNYEELTSPESMVRCNDPLSNAFKLTNEIRALKKNNTEVKSELKALTKKPKKFSVDLLDACETNKDVSVLFDSDESESNYQKKIIEMLKGAVHAKHKEFIAHRHVQQLLHTIVYADYPAKTFRRGFLHHAGYTLAFPILAFIFIFDFWGRCKITRYMRTPFGKFLSHTSQFCVFVALLVLSSLRDSHQPSAIEYLIFLFVLAMFFQQVHKVCNERCGYFRKWWNFVLSAMLMGFIIAGLLWLIGSRAIGGWSAVDLISSWDVAGHKILLLANSFFSISSVLSVFYLGSLCQVNYTFGPLQLSTLRMFKDILKFLIIFLGLFFAFTLGVRNLYSYNRSLQIEYFNRNSTEHNHTEGALSTFSDAWQVMFWALFDQTSVEKFETTHQNFKITSNTGKLLFAIYLISAVLVGINMLIAMMNNSFEYVTADKDCLNWKVSRTAMWLEFADNDTSYFLPPPYNIIQLPICIVRYIILKWKTERAEKIEMHELKSNKNNQLESRVNELEPIVNRYLKNKKRDLEQEEEIAFLEAYLKSKKKPQGQMLYESNV